MRMDLNRLLKLVRNLPDGPVEVVDMRGERTRADARRHLHVLENGILMVCPPTDDPSATVGSPVYLRADQVYAVRSLEGVEI